jgi:hypothetical protein
VLSLLRDTRNTAPDYNQVAVAAAQRGDPWAWRFLEDSDNEDPNYARVSAIAAQGGYTDLSIKINKLQLQRRELQMRPNTPYMMSADAQFLSRKRIGPCGRFAGASFYPHTVGHTTTLICALH